MKKKIINLVAIAFIVCLFGCNKETLNSDNNIKQPSQLPKQLGKFKKELIVADISGKNQAFYAIYSNDSVVLENYIKNNEMYLIIEDLPNFPSQNTGTVKADSTKLKSGIIDEDPTIWVDLITYKLENNVKSFSLAYKPSSLKSASSSYITSYSSDGSFIGIVTCGWGNGFWGKASYYNSWWDMMNPLSSATTYWTNFIDSNGYGCWGFIDLHKYKQYIQIWPTDNNYNWKVVYSIADFRGQSCTIGSYDTANCYVGTAPSGTTAFINYNPVNGDVYFYYTPLPGNICPVGLGFDGANCGYKKVPAGCEPFILGSNFYVKADLIIQ